MYVTKNPAQGILLVIDETREHLETQGLRTLFGLTEIRLKTQDVLQDLQQYAQVLTFILDTIATADELGLPYSYQNEFQFGEVNYTLYEEGEYAKALTHLERARRAPPRPGREIADAGRRAEIEALIAKAQQELD